MRLHKHELASSAAVWAASLALVALPAYMLWDWPTFDASILSEETQAAARCGDGKLDGREQCDDGNALIMDGCTGCMIEAGFTCTGTPSRCTQGGEQALAGCGNGVPDAGEQCDDRNAVTGDGCSSYCFIETGFTCEGVPSVCAPAEGSSSASSSDASSADASSSSDASSVSSEAASSVSSPDSPASTASSVPSAAQPAAAAASVASSALPRVNARAAKAMYASSAAAVTPPPPPPAPAGIKPSCGDERILGAETCDDGNAAGGDGCSASCAVETGYRCEGHPSRCAIACGDGVIMGDETCDDGGNNAGDGCSADCRTESRWRCSGAPSGCTPITYCGDGVAEGTETCDDGNDIAGDGCSATCTAEQPATVD